MFAICSEVYLIDSFELMRTDVRILPTFGDILFIYWSDTNMNLNFMLRSVATQTIITVIDIMSNIEHDIIIILTCEWLILFWILLYEYMYSYVHCSKTNHNIHQSPGKCGKKVSFTIWGFFFVHLHLHAFILCLPFRTNIYPINRFEKVVNWVLLHWHWSDTSIGNNK